VYFRFATKNFAYFPHYYLFHTILNKRNHNFPLQHYLIGLVDASTLYFLIKMFWIVQYVSVRTATKNTTGNYVVQEVSLPYSPPQALKQIKQLYSVTYFMTSILILFAYLALGIPSGLFVPVFWLKLRTNFSSVPGDLHSLHISPTLKSNTHLYTPVNIWCSRRLVLGNIYPHTYFSNVSNVHHTRSYM
jgi:hypothetical protein